MGQRVTVRRDSFATFFPAGMVVPALLPQFADWLDTVPYGSVGFFDVLGSAHLTDEFPEPRPPGELLSRLGLFLRLPDASWLALWNHGGTEPAVVLIGSEGELRNVAPSLRDFLVALSKGETGVSDLDDEDASSRRGALASWLSSTGMTRSEPAGSAPDFEGWYRATLAGQGAEPSAPVARTAPFSMAGFSSTLVPLLGLPATEPGVRAFLEALGHWPLPRFRPGEDLYLAEKAKGYCLLLKEGKSGVAELAGCFLYSEGKDGYSAFAHPMPRGVSWGDSASAVVTRIGAPTREITNKKTGELSTHRWMDGDGSRRYLDVKYLKSGAEIRHLFVGVMSSPG